MSSKRRNLNISLIILSMILGIWAALIIRQPIARSIPNTAHVRPSGSPATAADSVRTSAAGDTHTAVTAISADTLTTTSYKDLQTKPSPTDTRLRDADIQSMRIGNPFSAEVEKLINGHLEETDSISRHRILSYCEHLRTAYTTKDIDFIRQVFSDNALIIVGHIIRTGGADASARTGNSKVSYAVRTKKEYLKRLERTFASSSSIDVTFSGFRIMRHPTMDGIYGVTLRQGYTCDRYADDGFLFLLWDFRDPSMPMIHVRTWQPAPDVADMEDDLIDISDFNLE